MFNLPQPPKTRIVRQLACVCCQERFSIAEDDPVRKDNHTGNWQLPPNHYPDMTLRYQPDRTIRPVVPVTRTEPNRSAEAQKWNNERQSLNCPRCGADNRNWLHLFHPDDTATLKTINKWQRQNRDPVLLLLLASTAILVLAALIMLFSGLPIESLAPLAVAFFFMSTSTIFILAAPARIILRSQRFLNKSGMIVVGLAITILLVFLAYRNGISDAETGSQKILLPLVVLLAGAVPLISITNGWKSIRTYRQLKTVKPPEEKSVSPALQGWLKYTALFLFALPFVLYILIPVAFRLTFLALSPEAVQGEPWITVEKSFLATWFKFVLASSIIGLVFGTTAVNSYLNRIDPQLPLPLFSSIAAMTRVVVWEAKHALEIADETLHIQWMSVERNQSGGITLQGVFRDETPTPEGEDFPNTKVRAQLYELVSDQWGRITKAKIKTASASKRPYRQQQSSLGEALGEELFDFENRNQPGVILAK